MIDSIDENDLITLDDENKYFIISTIEEFGGKFHLLIRYLEDKEEFDYSDIGFVEEVRENGDIFLDPVKNHDLLEKLSTFTLTYATLEGAPELEGEVEKALKEMTNEDSF